MTTKWIDIYGNVIIEKKDERQYISIRNNHGLEVTHLQFVSKIGDELILFVPVQKVYLKVTDTDFKWGTTKENITYFLVNGNWEFKEGTNCFFFN